MAAGKDSGGNEAAASAREAELVCRPIACAAGLPRVCALKRCRRRKRCLGADLVCWRHHEGLLRKRYGSALARLGWARPPAIAPRACLRLAASPVERDAARA